MGKITITGATDIARVKAAGSITVIATATAGSVTSAVIMAGSVTTAVVMVTSPTGSAAIARVEVTKAAELQ